MALFSTYVKFTALLAFFLLIEASPIFAQDSTIALQSKLIVTLGKMDSIYQNYLYESEEGDSLFTTYLDHVQAILEDDWSDQIDFNAVIKSNSRFSKREAFSGKVNVFSWNAYTSAVYQSSSIHFLSLTDPTNHSLKKVHNGFSIRRLIELSDTCLLMETSSQSHRDCYFTSFFLSSMTAYETLLHQEAIASFSYGFGSEEEYIEYDSKSKSIRYSNRPCYYWEGLKDGEEYPLDKGVIRIDEKTCKAILEDE